MFRYRNNNRFFRRRNFNPYYAYQSYNFYNPYPEVARLPKKILYIIKRNTGSIINPEIYNPNERTRHYIMNCHAHFECKNCSHKWTSNLTTVELWWEDVKRQFDVRMYGQQCKLCNGEFVRPFIPSFYKIIDICVKVLNNKKVGKRSNINQNSNSRLNSPHDEKRCQK